MDTLSLAVSIGAFIAASIALIITAYFSWKQTRVAQNAETVRRRDEWCDGLRGEMQNFLSAAAMLHDTNDSIGNERPEENNEVGEQERRNLIRELRTAEAGVQLRLNPKYPLASVLNDRDFNPSEKTLIALCPHYVHISESTEIENLELPPSICPLFNKAIRNNPKANDADAIATNELAESFLPFCMHRMTRILGVKDENCRDSYPFEEELNLLLNSTAGEEETTLGKRARKIRRSFQTGLFYEAEDGKSKKTDLGCQFDVCYEGITGQARCILKSEWERMKSELGMNSNKS